MAPLLMPTRTPTALILRSPRSGRLEGRGRFQRALDPPSRRSLRLLLRMRTWVGQPAAVSDREPEQDDAARGRERLGFSPVMAGPDSAIPV